MASSASSTRIQSPLAAASDALRAAEKSPLHSNVLTCAPSASARSTVRSTEPVSTTMVSSATGATLRRLRTRFPASFFTIITTDSVPPPSCESAMRCGPTWARTPSAARSRPSSSSNHSMAFSICAMACSRSPRCNSRSMSANVSPRCTGCSPRASRTSRVARSASPSALAAVHRNSSVSGLSGDSVSPRSNSCSACAPGSRAHSSAPRLA